MNKLFKVLKQNLMMLKKKKNSCFVKCSNKTLLNGINEVCNWKIWWYNNVFDVSHVVLVGFKRFDQKNDVFFSSNRIYYYMGHLTFWEMSWKKYKNVNVVNYIFMTNELQICILHIKYSINSHKNINIWCWSWIVLVVQSLYIFEVKIKYQQFYLLILSNSKVIKIGNVLSLL